jgi:hypothetical protein
MSAMGHPDRNIRAFAVRTLGSSPELTLKGATAISERLHDPVVEVRVAAAAALGDAGAIARPLLPGLLRENKENSEGQAREAIGQAISRINAAPSRSRFGTWLLSIAILAAIAAGLGFWYRSMPTAVAPVPER